MRRAFEYDIEDIEKYYFISEEGMVYSKVKKRWLKPSQNNYKYVFYCLTYGLPKSTWFFAHTLVALKYIGKPPTDKHEIDHLDEDKSNNHYSNLVWRTHGDNIRCSYARGRRGYWLDRSKPSPTLETKLKMANAKKKRVQYVLGDSSIVFGSIEEASSGLNTYRKKIYNCIKNGKPFQEGVLSFVQDEPPI